MKVVDFCNWQWDPINSSECIHSPAKSINFGWQFADCVPNASMQCCILVRFHRHIPISVVRRPHLNTKARNYFDTIFVVEVAPANGEWRTHRRTKRKFYDDLMTIQFFCEARARARRTTAILLRGEIVAIKLPPLPSPPSLHTDGRPHNK